MKRVEHPAPPATPATGNAAETLARLLAEERPFALLRRRTPGHDPNVVEVLSGSVEDVERLSDIPLPRGAAGPAALALVPFRQLAERGFEVTDDGTPLTVLRAEHAVGLPLDEALAALPDHRVAVADGAFDVSDERYAEIVTRVLETEIGAGEGANFVIRRTFTGTVEGFTRADALALFRRLLVAERGAYWTFVVHTGERVLVGASPEVHVRMSGSTVVMNPISGTYRYPPEGPSLDGLLTFLDDAKEIEELSMVVDEELKMMCAVGDRGGVVVGPRLREMAHLAHTEYELRGRSTWDVREVLRETMFAATVTGSPVENACRVIARHEPGGRGYYAGALALLGHDASGGQTLDSPILIRTAEVRAADGRLRVPVGATLVRGSDPASEVAETHAKAAGVLAALGVRPEAPAPARDTVERPRLAEHPEVVAALAARRAHLSPFWLRMREPAPEAVRAAAERAPAARVLVLDAEDSFTSMLAHLLRVVGAEVEVVRWNAPGARERALAHPGPVVLGPGPGDPNDGDDPRMRRLRPLAAELLAGHRHGLVGVCLGHELLAAELGLPVVRKRRPYQGAQERIDLFGTERTVGFYNSFTARCTEETAGELAGRGVTVSRDAAGEVHALRGPGFVGVQFHPESVLTIEGPAIVAELLSPAGAPAL
ncbi:phenazine-specific anthranilate synthase component I [Streptomyces sp. 3MP-14]|uniref:anthranilate synthase n=1 Tax=Streptomyces mimosae TaxID=2586635 RepID=A0A5N6AL79_9ACTN|nr:MULTISPECIES: anthranilate synthase family protein [Streptomyces]KAB8168640.1 phenazine-specific anthranilate synthase component I [Streptomyces mimosae]KAB8178080.1 phenazine-specific anthranilate synthase component I [Streptomyces sp. 3MP-14]